MEEKTLIRIYVDDDLQLQEAEIQVKEKIASDKVECTVHKKGHMAGFEDYDVIIATFFVEKFFDVLIGKEVTRVLEQTKSEILDIIYSVLAFYKVFIRKHESLSEKACTVNLEIRIENVHSVSMKCVFNHSRISDELINKIPDALKSSIEFLKSRAFELNIIAAQLYPDFQKQSWDYLFIPTRKAYGNFVDRYFNFADSKIYNIESAEEFVKTFNVEKEDYRKLIIEPRL